MELEQDVNNQRIHTRDNMITKSSKKDVNLCIQAKGRCDWKE